MMRAHKEMNLTSILLLATSLYAAVCSLYAACMQPVCPSLYGARASHPRHGVQVSVLEMVARRMSQMSQMSQMQPSEGEIASHSGKRGEGRLI
jgi:hypothetical protein